MMVPFSAFVNDFYGTESWKMKIFPTDLEENTRKVRDMEIYVQSYMQ